jgi:hypothetical protein
VLFAGFTVVDFQSHGLAIKEEEEAKEAEEEV